MIRGLLAATALLVAPAAALAGTAVVPCGDSARADAIAEPWEANIAAYADGQVRVALLDQAEPAGGSVWLMVVSPPRDELGLRQCRLVGMDNGLGFYALDFAGRTSAYDAQRGLTLTLPGRRSPDLGGADGGTAFRLVVTVNQQTGAIDARVAP